MLSGPSTSPSALGSAPASTPPKRCYHKAHTNASVPVTQTLVHRLRHPRCLAHRALHLDHYPFVRSFILPAHRVRPAVRAGTVCPPRELAAERGARCTIKTERELILCAGGKEDVKQERTKGKDNGKGVRACAGSSSASLHYETSKLKIRSC